jgi:hypothetical protein
MAILHFQRFGINIDEGFPEPNADGPYPSGDDDNADTEKPDEIDEMITDEDVDDTGEPDDDDEMCEPVAGDYCQDYCGK